MLRSPLSIRDSVMISMTHHILSTEIAIFGGGVAGLWLLNRLVAQDVPTLLFESHTLGGGQTIKSQGIIHGGMKYALTGKLSADAAAVADMPARWQACLAGTGDIDLAGVPVLSDKQYLFSPSAFQASLLRLFASRALAGQVEQLSKAAYPAPFQHPGFKGRVFALNEIVLDVPALIQRLVQGKEKYIFQSPHLHEEDLLFQENGALKAVRLRIADEVIEVHAKQFVFTAGSGNELLFRATKQPGFAMQRRPLRMVLVDLPFHAPLYAHCVGLGARPRLTITTPYVSPERTIWYLGGALAEEGMSRLLEEQAQCARQELEGLFPWLDFSRAQYHSFAVDRAEPLQPKGEKPISTYVQQVQNMLVAWPTKLALAPKLADEMMGLLSIAACAGTTNEPSAARQLMPLPAITPPLWETLC
jgi:glycine/D-amino acid oxidase-like deaminating enzyme